jgi:hypothetical protein
MLVVDFAPDIVFGYLYSVMTEWHQTCKLLSSTDQYKWQKCSAIFTWCIRFFVLNNEIVMLNSSVKNLALSSHLNVRHLVRTVYLSSVSNTENH